MIIGVAAGAAAALFGGGRLANSFAADDASASKRMYMGAALNIAAGFALYKWLGMKGLGAGLIGGGVVMGGMGYNAGQFEDANPGGASLVNGAAAVLGLPSPVALDANHHLPAPSTTTTTTTTTGGTQSTTSPLVIARY